MLDSGTFTCRKRRRMGKRGRKAQLSRLHEGKRGSSMTSKQNRGGPASPSHPPWLHRNTRAMPSLQTRSFPLSSATLHYPVLSQAQRATAPLSLHYSRAPARSLPTRLTQRPGGVYMLPLRHQVTLSLNVYCRGKSGRTQSVASNLLSVDRWTQIFKMCSSELVSNTL